MIILTESFPPIAAKVQKTKKCIRSCCSCRRTKYECSIPAGPVRPAPVPGRHILRYDQSRRRLVRGVDARGLFGVGTRSAHHWDARCRPGGGHLELLPTSVQDMLAARSDSGLSAAGMQRGGACRVREAKRLGIERRVQVALRKAL